MHLISHSAAAATAEFLSCKPFIFKQNNPRFLTLKWELPPLGWCSLNTDGSYLSELQLAGAGGVIRDHQGQWMGGFAKCLGNMNSFQAELWAVREGLQTALQCHLFFIQLNIDSQAVVNAIQDDSESNHAYGNLISNCRSMLRNFQGVTIRHVYREVNTVADCLAKHGAHSATLLFILMNLLILYLLVMPKIGPDCIISVLVAEP